jgi:homoserine acetyltransferase
MSFKVTKQLPDVKAKTLVIGVDDGEVFPPSSFKPVAEANPGAKIFSYDSIFGHLGCAFDLEKASKAMTDFLK